MSKKQSSDHSKTIQDIKQEGSLAMLREEIDRLNKLVESQQEYIGNLISTIDMKDKELIAVKNNTTVESINISDEEQIALVQLQILKQKAASGELTLDDTRKFDLLVKNKRLAQGSATTIDAEYKSLNGKSTDDLLLIASGKK